MKDFLKAGVLFLLIMQPLRSESQFLKITREDKTREEYIAVLIDSLSSKESQNDTTQVIKYACVLTTQMHLSTMFDRSFSYLEIARKYANNFSDKSHLSQVATRGGSLYLALSKNHLLEKMDTSKFITILDSSFLLHRQSVAYSRKHDNNMSVGGWAYRALMENCNTQFIYTGVECDSMKFYYQTGMKVANDHEDLELKKGLTNQLLRYSLNTKELSIARVALGQLRELDEDLYDLPYKNALHDLIAMEHGLDTLVSLRRDIWENYKIRTAAEHNQILYDTDQKYEVTKTKDQLEDTQGELFQSKRILAVSIIVGLLIAFISIYFFYLNRKNKQLSKRNELLLKEQNHRVKNNLQMINSLLSLQSQKLLSTDAKEALNESQLRINSVALLHRMLYEGENVGKVNTKEYLNTLTEEIKYSVPRDFDLQMSIPDHLELAIEKATSLGLIINELMTNSLKHVDEKIELTINITLNESNNQLILNYADNGSGISEEAWNTSQSFGNQLIRIQSEQLRGSYHIKGSDGFRYELKLGA